MAQASVSSHSSSTDRGANGQCSPRTMTMVQDYLKSLGRASGAAGSSNRASRPSQRGSNRQAPVENTSTLTVIDRDGVRNALNPPPPSNDRVEKSRGVRSESTALPACLSVSHPDGPPAKASTGSGDGDAGECEATDSRDSCCTTNDECPLDGSGGWSEAREGDRFQPSEFTRDEIFEKLLAERAARQEDLHAALDLEEGVALLKEDLHYTRAELEERELMEETLRNLLHEAEGRAERLEKDKSSLLSELATARHELAASATRGAKLMEALEEMQKRENERLRLLQATDNTRAATPRLDQEEPNTSLTATAAPEVTGQDSSHEEAVSPALSASMKGCACSAAPPSPCGDEDRALEDSAMGHTVSSGCDNRTPSITTRGGMARSGLATLGYERVVKQPRSSQESEGSFSAGLSTGNGAMAAAAANPLTYRDLGRRRWQALYTEAQSKIAALELRLRQQQQQHVQGHGTPEPPHIDEQKTPAAPRIQQDSVCSGTTTMTEETVGVVRSSPGHFAAGADALSHLGTSSCGGEVIFLQGALSRATTDLKRAERDVQRIRESSKRQEILEKKLLSDLGQLARQLRMRESMDLATRQQRRNGSTVKREGHVLGSARQKPNEDASPAQVPASGPSEIDDSCLVYITEIQCLKGDVSDLKEELATVLKERKEHDAAHLAEMEACRREMQQLASELLDLQEGSQHRRGVWPGKTLDSNQSSTNSVPGEVAKLLQASVEQVIVKKSSTQSALQGGTAVRDSRPGTQAISTSSMSVKSSTMRSAPCTSHTAVGGGGGLVSNLSGRPLKIGTSIPVSLRRTNLSPATATATATTHPHGKRQGQKASL